MSRPLAGACLLVTRARSQAAAMVEQIEALGGRAYCFPVIAIADPEDWAPLDRALAQLTVYAWVIFTSTNGVDQFLRRGGSIPPGARVAAVGAATARRLEECGVRVDLIPPTFRGAALPGAMAPLLSPGDRVLMPRGDLADPALAAALTKLGAVVDDVVAYRTVRASGDGGALREAMLQGEVHYALFTSGSTVAGLVERLGGIQALGGVRVAVIGPETRKAAEAAGLTVAVQPPQATVERLLQAVAADWSTKGP